MLDSLLCLSEEGRQLSWTLGIHTGNWGKPGFKRKGRKGLSLDTAALRSWQPKERGRNGPEPQLHRAAQHSGHHPRHGPVAGRETLDFAIEDSGATEAVRSLEAMKAVMASRRKQYGLETAHLYPQAIRRFWLRTGQQQSAKSNAELPQTLKSWEIYLGCFALDVDKCSFSCPSKQWEG